MKSIKQILSAGALTLGLATGAQALQLTVVDSLVYSGAFGVLYDGTNIWSSDSSGTLRKINQSDMTFAGPSVNLGRWSANAWDGSHFLTAQGNKIFKTNVDGTSAGDITITLSGGLIDGLDTITMRFGGPGTSMLSIVLTAMGSQLVPNLRLAALAATQA